MNVTERPRFQGGIEALCSATNFLAIVEAEGGIDPASLYRMIISSTSPYPLMLAAQGARVGRLDPSNSEAACLQCIWRALNFSSADNVWNFKTNLRNWVDSYKTNESITPLAISFLNRSSIVFVRGESSNDPSNAFPVEKVGELSTLIGNTLALFRISAQNPLFWDRVMVEVMQLASLKEGRELLTELLQYNLPIIIREGEGDTLDCNTNTVELSPHSTEVYSVQSTLRTLTAIKVTTLAHELLHLLHHLKRLPDDSYENSGELLEVFANLEERRTVCGTPNSTICENSLAATLDIPTRYGDVAGNLQTNAPATTLKFLCDHGISGDLTWVLPTISDPHLLGEEFNKTLHHLREDLSPTSYSATVTRLTRWGQPHQGVLMPIPFQTVPASAVRELIRPAALKAQDKIQILMRLHDRLKELATPA